MTRFPRTDAALLGAIVTLLILSSSVAIWDESWFNTHFAVEDGPIEYATAALLFAATIIFIRNIRALAAPTKTAIGFTLLYALMFFLAAGEEISWSQRIFGWDSNEFFVENNFQNETNLHNLVVGNVHLASFLFGHILSILTLAYLVVLPFLIQRPGIIKNVAEKLAFPAPGKRHALLAVIATIVISFTDATRKWEVYELVFALLTTSIFLNPTNAIYCATGETAPCDTVTA